MAGTLFVVATPIGNLEDITMRALRVLGEVSLIAAEDTRRTAHLLSRYGITTKTTSLHQHNERGKSSSLIARLLAGDSLALVSDAGTPAISDPGAELVSQARAAGVRIEPIPGPSALTTLLSVAGQELEHFVFLGFPPARSKDRKLWLDRLGQIRMTAVFYEAPHRIQQTLSDIRRTVGDVEAFVGRELTKSHEQLAKGPISAISDGLEERGEFVVALYLAEQQKTRGPEQPPPTLQISSEFYELTNNGGLTRRGAITAIAKRHGMTSRDIYAAVELHKGIDRA